VQRVQPVQSAQPSCTSQCSQSSQSSQSNPGVWSALPETCICSFVHLSLRCSLFVLLPQKLFSSLPYSHCAPSDLETHQPHPSLTRCHFITCQYSFCRRLRPAVHIFSSHAVASTQTSFLSESPLHPRLTRQIA
jgi:hypothetical protein